MTLYEAIFNRKSVRRYQMDRIPVQVFNHISKFIDGLSGLYPEIHYEVRIYSMLDKEAEVKSLMKANAPYYLVIYSEDCSGAYENAGYLMEQIVLYLTSKGIGTCYQGSLKLKSKEQESGLMQTAAIAFGYAKDKLYRDAGRAKRIRMKDLCVIKEEIPKELMTMLEAARLAPSALNYQPWRFVVYSNRIHVFVRKEKKMEKYLEKIHYIDAGIVLSHLELAAEEMWLSAETIKVEQISDKEIKNNRYILSILISS